jgi:hypothetical protein
MPRNQKIIAIAACLLVVPALACGGGKKSTATAEPSTASGGATQATASSGSGAPTTASGGAVSGNEIASFVSALLKVKSFRATLSTNAGGQAQIQGAMEAQLPDRFHLTTPTIELISIGNDSYTKIGGNWTKSSGAGIGNIFQADELNALATAVPSGQITKGGTDTVNGTKCQLYTQNTSSSSTTEYCVANNLPLRVVSTSGSTKTTIVFSDFDKPVDIKAPI